MKQNLEIESFDNMISPKEIASKWSGPNWNQLSPDGPIKQVKIHDEESIDKFFKSNIDNHLSQHDFNLFARWSITVVDAALKYIKDKRLKYEFLIHLLRPDPTNNNKRFFLRKTFRKLSKRTNELIIDWDSHLDCHDVDFAHTESLKLFDKWLEAREKSMRHQHSKKRSRSQIENQHSTSSMSFESKLKKLESIFSQLNKDEKIQALLSLEKGVAINPYKKRRL